MSAPENLDRLERQDPAWYGAESLASQETTDMGCEASSVAPGDLVTCLGEVTTVRRVVIHSPGQHPDSPIVNTMFAVEAATARGSRWAGGTSARINSELAAEWSR